MATSTINAVSKDRFKLIESGSFTINAGQHTNQTIQFGETITSIKAVVLISSPNAAWIFGSIQDWDTTYATCGFYNSASSNVTGKAIIGVIY